MKNLLGILDLGSGFGYYPIDYGTTGTILEPREIKQEMRQCEQRKRK